MDIDGYRWMDGRNGTVLVLRGGGCGGGSAFGSVDDAEVRVELEGRQRVVWEGILGAAAVRRGQTRDDCDFVRVDQGDRKSVV